MPVNFPYLGKVNRRFMGQRKKRKNRIRIIKMKSKQAKQLPKNPLHRRHLSFSKHRGSSVMKKEKGIY